MKRTNFKKGERLVRFSMKMVVLTSFQCRSKVGLIYSSTLSTLPRGITDFQSPAFAANVDYFTENLKINRKVGNNIDLSGFLSFLPQAQRFRQTFSPLDFLYIPGILPRCRSASLLPYTLFFLLIYVVVKSRG